MITLDEFEKNIFIDKISKKTYSDFKKETSDFDYLNNFDESLYFNVDENRFDYTSESEYDFNGIYLWDCIFIKTKQDFEKAINKTISEYNRSFHNLGPIVSQIEDRSLYNIFDRILYGELLMTDLKIEEKYKYEYILLFIRALHQNNIEVPIAFIDKVTKSHPILKKYILQTNIQDLEFNVKKYVGLIDVNLEKGLQYLKDSIISC